MGSPTCTVVIPTFNERETLPSLVDRLMAIPGVRVLVVDDASPDGTGQLADTLVSAFPGRVEVLHRTGRGGIGSAYVEGMQRALTHGTALVAQMDADLSHDVRYLPDLIAATADADLAIGSRYVPGGGVSNWSFGRRLLSRFANRYVRLITGLPVKDGTGGYRCWRRETLIELPLPKLVSNGYAFMVEMAWETFQRRLRITEVPIVFVERRQGTLQAELVRRVRNRCCSRGGCGGGERGKDIDLPPGPHQLRHRRVGACAFHAPGLPQHTRFRGLLDGRRPRRSGRASLSRRRSALPVQARIPDFAVVPCRQDRSPHFDFLGSDEGNPATEGDTLWVNYSTKRFSSRSMAF